MKRKVIISCIVIFILVVSGGFLFNNYSKSQELKKFISLGNKYLEEQNYNEAILAYEEAIKVEPKNVEARIGLAKAYIGLNKMAEAEKALMDALGITKKNPRVYIELAKLYIKLDRGKDAIDILTTGYNETKDDEVKKLLDELMAQPEAPGVNIKGGSYDYAQEVAISTTGDSSIYYTLDNTTPNTNSNKYSGPILIGNGKTVLRVIAVSKAGIPSKENIIEYNIGVKPFNKDDLILSKIEMGMIQTKVIEVLGNPKNRRSEFDDYQGIDYALLDYPFGTLWFDKSTSELERFNITTNDIAVGLRNIKIGDSVESVISKFPNKGEIKYPETVLYEIYESAGIINKGGITYDSNNKIDSVIIGTGWVESEYGSIMIYGIVDGKVSYIDYWQ